MYSTIEDNDQQQSIRDTLTEIKDHIEKDLALKQRMVQHLELQASRMNTSLSQRDQKISLLEKEVKESQQMQEGMRQLINKLLSDIGNYQKDISWYKRTFETRSLLGILKDKFIRKRSTGNKDV